MNRVIKYGSITAWVIFMIVCAYYMIHNAFWLGGDEAIVMNATGWGHAFVPPREPFSIGRFFPLSYNLYNILLIFPHGVQVSTTSIYILQAFALCVFSIFIWLMGVQITKSISDRWCYPISLLAVFFAVSRVYHEFVTCYTGVWIVFSLLPAFMWFAWRFSETKKSWCAILALVIVNYIIYCYETVFTIPMTIGAIALIINHKRLSKKEIWFYASLVGSAALFLILYVALVIPQTVVAYDGAHGQDISMLGNAINIFIAQKTMWVVALLLAFRVYDCIRYKKHPCFFDYLILASCAYCCGAAALKLNFIYYYNAAVIIAIPSIIYFGLQYIKPFGTFILLLLFAGFYGAKLPKMIENNQTARVGYLEFSRRMTEYVKNGDTVYWYSPVNTEISDYDLEFRSWTIGYTESVIGYTLVQEDYQISVRDTVTSEPGLWFVMNADTCSFVNNMKNKEVLLDGGGRKCYRIK